MTNPIMLSLLTSSTSFRSERIRVRGIVQGVGFRPTVWTIARQYKLRGSVCNDGDGVFIKLHGTPEKIDKFVSALKDNCPPLAQIDAIEREVYRTQAIPDDFFIDESYYSQAHTHLPADAATCSACVNDINDPENKRYRYAFTNCTHCGPRLSIIKGIPYDRAQTTMSEFALCETCQNEYETPSDRRFHAQPNACPDCGPQVWLEDGRRKQSRAYNAIRLAAKRLKAGKVLAIKGIGGIHLAVDAHNDAAIAILRRRKHRPDKPLALMAKDLSQVERYCRVTLLDAQQLLDASAPIVVLPRLSADCRLSCKIAPNQNHLGFMLPYTPLHHLLMQQLDHPIVLTSGNHSNEPQCIDNATARTHLRKIADSFLLHDRDIENRLDDSVIRHSAGSYRVLRRARGYAPHPLQMPKDFFECPDLLAMGGELKNTFCLFKDQQAVLSQHIGDLENHATYKDYEKNIQLYTQLYQHKPKAIVVDKHPEYLSTKLGKMWAEKLKIPLIEVQHHHAHIAACLAENQQSLSARPVLGIALDGLGFGDDGSLWGGELLLADYKQSQRLGYLRPVPLLGGAQAMREPWRNTYAHLHDAHLWENIQKKHINTPIVDYLKKKPLETLNQMIRQKVNSPYTSSCGRLFDAVAAAIGICTEKISYEGQAAIEMEALLANKSFVNSTQPYPFDLQMRGGVTQIDPLPMWKALFADLEKKVPAHLISARFHCGLANALILLSQQLIKRHNVTQVVLTGGVFQNKVLFEAVHRGLLPHAEVLTHHLVPANDGGLALGQAAIAAAQLMNQEK